MFKSVVARFALFCTILLTSNVFATRGAPWPSMEAAMPARDDALRYDAALYPGLFDLYDKKADTLRPCRLTKSTTLKHIGTDARYSLVAVQEFTGSQKTKFGEICPKDAILLVPTENTVEWRRNYVIEVLTNQKEVATTQEEQSDAGEYNKAIMTAKEQQKLNAARKILGNGK